MNDRMSEYAFSLIHSFYLIIGLTQNLKNWWLSGAEAPILAFRLRSTTQNNHFLLYYTF